MTNPPPAIAPYVPTYASYTPYITVDDYAAEPTGVDWSQLVPGNTDMAVQRAALARVIVRASAEADNLCGPKILAATVDVVAGRFRIQSDGKIYVPVEFIPTVMVLSVSIGSAPNAMTEMTDLSGIWPGEKVVEIPVGGGGLAVPGMPLPAPGYARRSGWVYVRMTYVNGWAHDTLSSAASAGDRVITPVSTVGIVPGLPMTVQDGAGTESVTVASWYIPGLANVPLAGPLGFDHAPGVTVSALPPVVRDATILLTSHKIKTRGAQAIVMGSAGSQPSRSQKIDPGGSSEYAEAKELLAPFKRAI